VRYRATLAYDGAPFQGYQRQKDGVPTVQATVEGALQRIGQAPVTVYAAGRTDTGVHATGQVIAFDLDWNHGEAALCRALNSNLPASVAITDLALTEAGFHPRFDALDRTYRYTIVVSGQRRPLLRHTAWVVHKPLAIAPMRQAARLLLGKQDFAALGRPPTGHTTIREVMAAELDEIHIDGDTWVRFTITANAFLYRMVRRTTGLLYDVGRGKFTPDHVSALLKAAVIAKGVTIAPPQGLVLTRVRYPGD
jgi:tRNA pseudouridine38-40 synthase